MDGKAHSFQAQKPQMSINWAVLIRGYPSSQILIAAVMEITATERDEEMVSTTPQTRQISMLSSIVQGEVGEWVAWYA